MAACLFDVISTITAPVEAPVRERGLRGRTERLADLEGRGRASADGTDDPYCHLFLGNPPFRYTACLVRLREPLPIERTHPEPPSRCPNHHPPCPECTRGRA
jgi:hypothetical protein